MIFSVIELTPAPRNRRQLIEILRLVVDLTRPASGCAGCWLSEENYSHSQIQYCEQWDSEEALHDHIRSELYLRLLSAIELSHRAPKVDFYYTSEIKGFELIESIRQQPPHSRSGGMGPPSRDPFA